METCIEKIHTKYDPLMDVLKKGWKVNQIITITFWVREAMHKQFTEKINNLTLSKYAIKNFDKVGTPKHHKTFHKSKGYPILNKRKLNNRQHITPPP